MGKKSSKKRITAPATKQGILIKANEPTSSDQLPVIFSFERVQPGAYCFSTLDSDAKAAAADSIFKRRSLTWSQVRELDRHGLGTEKIPRKEIKGAAIPKFLTEEKETLLVFRYNGLAPMVGHRINQVFYILWFDHDFTLYDHGSK